MNVFLVLLFVILIWKVKFSGGDWNDPLSPKITSGMKAAASLMVVLHHLSQNSNYVPVFSEVGKGFGTIAVALFFFYSGYGLMKSHMSRENYSRGFFVKRILSVALPYMGFVLIYWAMSFVNRAPYSVGYVLMAYRYGSPIVKFSWFIIVIIFFYLEFYLMMKLLKKRCALYFPLSLLGLALWIYICLKLGWGMYWYISAVAFSLGIAMAAHENGILAFFKKLWPLLLLLSLALLSYSVYRMSYGVTYISMLWSNFAASISFCLFVVLLTMKFAFSNKILDFVGRISLELYLIHGLAIDSLRGTYLYIGRDIPFSVGVFLISIPAAFVLHFIFEKMNRFVQRKLLK